MHTHEEWELKLPRFIQQRSTQNSKIPVPKLFEGMSAFKNEDGLGLRINQLKVKTV